jgi:hypothetical protein
LQDFRDLRGEAEIAAAEAALRPVLGDAFFAPTAYHRCQGDGCRRVQKKTNWRVGAYLPPEF